MSKVDSMIKAGKCQIPTCTCQQYLDPIQKIDEDLVVTIHISK